MKMRFLYLEKHRCQNLIALGHLLLTKNQSAEQLKTKLNMEEVIESYPNKKMFSSEY
ncbi:hypothetical protein PMIT1323_00806 [Prochlorococcus marinus str. MIT 1323]|nr:hypothetical protein PMIT1323_00806 [Prochlorococcus marinus str. MIT 1323]